MSELVITADRVVLGPADHTLDDGAVHVVDGHIAAVGPVTELTARVSPAARWLRYPGGTVLPGLIDCHVHLTFDAEPDVAERVQHADDAELFDGMAERARLLLDSGVTTVRDLGDRGGLTRTLRDDIAAGDRAGPTVLAAGPPLTVPGGHCWFLGGEVTGSTGIRARVRALAENGSDLVKIMASGGGLTPGGADSWQSQFTREELAVAADEAHAAGLRIAAHAHGTDAIAAAAEAGVDTVEHCTWMTEDGFDADPDVAARLAERGIAVCVGASPNWRGLYAAFGTERADAMFRRIPWMADQGITLLAGTDAGVPRAVFDAFPSSLEFYAHLGFATTTVLDMATTRAASALGIGDHTGRLTPGHRADLLVVDGDPLADLGALRAPRLVLAGGREHPLAAADAS